MKFQRVVTVFVCLFSFSLVQADQQGERIFWAGFKQIQDKPHTAPSATCETQPIEGPVTLNFDNLKDPKITPEFRVREKWKDAIPGLSMCRVNPAGEMQIDLDLENDCILMHGDNPKVSGYVGRRFIERDPTAIEAVVQRMDPAEQGSVYLIAKDVVTGAFFILQWMNSQDAKGSWAITYSESETWEDWKWWSPAGLGVQPGSDVKLAIQIVRPGVLQAFVNDKPVGPQATIKDFVHMTEMRVGCSAQMKGVKIISLAAWRDEPRVSKKTSVYRANIQPSTATTFTPTNPYGTGIQAPYPERGFADAMNDPELFNELAQILRDLNTRVIRFPGGCWTYAYSSNGPESMDGLRQVNDAYVLNRDVFGWADAKRYFELCKAVGADSIYELNLAYWYDPEAKKGYRIALQDAGSPDLESKPRPLEYHLDKLPFALKEAQKIAQWAKEVGVKVYWEFGNEDYCYFTPKTYVALCDAFYKAIKEVDPKAEFIICGDGYSWADWRWPHAVFDEMKKAGMTDIACVSNHVYMYGGTGIPFINGQYIYDGLLASWANIKHLHNSDRAKLDSLGYTNTKLAITEGNIAAPPSPITEEHHMGRTLGEAEIFAERIKQYFMLVHHDMVRNDSPEKAGAWFCRILYYPQNPKGERYKLPLDGEVMKVMHQHAIREIIYNSKGITASQWNDGILVSAGNALPVDRNIQLTFANGILVDGKITATCYSTEDLDTPVFKTHEIPVTVTQNDSNTTISFTVPKYSFCFFKAGASK